MALKAWYGLSTRKTFRVLLEDEQLTVPDSALIRAPTDRVVPYADILLVSAGGTGSRALVRRCRG